MVFPVNVSFPMKWRVGAVLLVGGALLIAYAVLYLHYLRGLEVQTARTAGEVMNRLEKVLLQASSSVRHVSLLAGRPCEEILPELRKAAVFSPYVRTFKLAQQNGKYCSSLSGEGRLSESVGTFFADRVQLLGETQAISGGPVLLLREPLGEGMAVIASVDSQYLASMLSMGLQGEQAWLRVGERWLDEKGRFYSVQPAVSQQTAMKTQTSIHFPLSVSVNYPKNMGSILHWMGIQWRLLFVVAGSALFCALTLWFWLGRIRLISYELNRGMKANEFVPYVQPLVDAQTRKLCGVEVLMRWHHPTAGMINPTLFIPQAETSGLIVPITSQMMKQVATTLSANLERLPSHFHVGINVSAAHFTSMKLVDDCRAFLAHFPIGSVILTLELTERELLHNNAQSQRLFDALRAIGVRFALDDFGTGHASLAYLKQFHVDCIKLDHSFVRQIGLESVSQHIVDNVIDLGMKLGLVLVAEGVETDFQAEYLRDKGVDWLQGYLFAHPSPIGTFFEDLTPFEV